MNSERRNGIQEIRDSLDDIISRIEELKDEEQDALDNMPEGLQWSARGDKMQEAIGSMDNAGSSIEKARQSLGAAAR